MSEQRRQTHLPGQTVPNGPVTGHRGISAEGATALTILLVATVAPRIEGVNVYFRVFDVDDPFDQVHGPGGAGTEIANVQLLDSSPTAGGDNRGSSTGLGFVGPVTTDADGKASITLTVSMQPGDNYRAAASVIPEAVADAFGGGSCGRPPRAHSKIPSTFSRRNVLSVSTAVKLIAYIQIIRAACQRERTICFVKSLRSAPTQPITA